MTALKWALAILVLPLSPAAYCCIVGAMGFDGKNLTTCERDVLGEVREVAKVDNADFLGFLKAHESDKTLKADVSQITNMPMAEAESYFANEIASKHWETRIFLDPGDAPDGMLRIVKLYNDEKRLSEAVSREKEQVAQQKKDLRQSEPIASIEQLDAVARANESALRGLASQCKSREASPSAAPQASALEVVFKSDNEKQLSLPLSTMHLNGASRSIDLTYMNGDGSQETRTIYWRKDGFVYVGKDKKEWQVELNKISYLRLTQMRPMNFGSMTDGCFLSWRYQKGQTAAHPPGDGVPAAD
jgi:hypothetical protein